MVAVFREVWRVLRDDGTLWLNLGDSYAGSWGNYGGQNRGGGHQREIVNGSRAVNPAYDGLERWKPPQADAPGLKPKDLCGMPWRVAFALQQPWLRCRGCAAESHTMQWGRWPNGRLICPSCELSKGHEVSASGWYLRSDVIWAKPNPMPESVTDRPTRSHEYLFLLAKSERYFYDADAIRDPLVGELHTPGNRKITHMDESRVDAVWGNPAGRNKRDVWTVNSEPCAEAHFATFPQALVTPCILAGTSERGCCSECGAPRVRVVESEFTPTGSTKKAGVKGLAASGWDVPRGSVTNTTTGWQPSCAHDAPSIPCVVFDPFIGSGTVGRVCERLGRRWAGLDLSADYLEIARNRTRQMGFRWADGR